MEWLSDNRIKVDPPKKPKKLTGTRFAAVLGLNRWASPFNIWCAVTRTYEEPFEDTIYTIAGKTIEPKQAEYMKESYFMPTLVGPTDLWGENYFKKTWGDFFHDWPVLGGMWDYLLLDDEGKPKAVLEMKTTKRAEDWAEDTPEYYALQAALYAYLLGVDQVVMVASFLDEGDYDHPENFVCSAENTIVRPFKLSERYPTFEKDFVNPVQKWWEDHVETGISPVYDEKVDADILKALRTNVVTADKVDIGELIAHAEQLKARIDLAKALIEKDEKEYKKVSEVIKESAMSQFRDGDKKVTLAGGSYTWEISKTTSTKVDKKLMEKDGVLEKYTYSEDSYKLNVKAKEEEK